MAIERWKKALEGEKKFWREHSYAFPTFQEEKDLLKKYNIETDNKRLLEIGGGATSIVDLLTGERYSLDPLMDFFLENYNLPKDVNHIRGMGEELPFADNFFDIIFCLNALDHAENPTKVLQEAYRCIAPNGIFFMTLNCYSPQIAKLRRFSENIGAGDICHPYCFTIDEIKNELAQQGFELLEQTEDPFFEEKFQTYLKNEEPKVSFMKRLLSVAKLRGWGYLFRRALILPLHFIATRIYKSYPRVYFICRKI